MCVFMEDLTLYIFHCHAFGFDNGVMVASVSKKEVCFLLEGIMKNEYYFFFTYLVEFPSETIWV
jgi:hypothetical protein